MMQTRSTGLLILAAGESSRLGKPKQQLVFEGLTLLQRAIHAGLRSFCERPLVILGAYHEKILPEIPSHLVDMVINPDWKEGMSTSIKSGMKALLNTPGPDQVVIMLCDQPFVDEKLLNQLIKTQQETGKPIVACTYHETVGVPVLFDKKFYPLLVGLQGKEGAKKILNKFPEDIATVPFPLGHIDIDTPADIKHLKDGELNGGKKI